MLEVQDILLGSTYSNEAVWTSGKLAMSPGCSGKYTKTVYSLWIKFLWSSWLDSTQNHKCSHLLLGRRISEQMLPLCTLVRMLFNLGADGKVRIQISVFNMRSYSLLVRPFLPLFQLYYFFLVKKVCEMIQLPTAHKTL